MKNVWQLQEAKNQLSTVVENALQGGVQTITRHGKPAVVVVAVRQFEKLRKPKRTLIQVLEMARGAGLNLKRLKEIPRDIKL